MNNHKIYILIDAEGDTICAAETREIAKLLIDESIADGGNPLTACEQIHFYTEGKKGSLAGFEATP